jgi:parallel beta-helix repeat protein
MGFATFLDHENRISNNDFIDNEKTIVLSRSRFNIFSGNDLRSDELIIVEAVLSIAIISKLTNDWHGDPKPRMDNTFSFIIINLPI